MVLAIGILVDDAIVVVENVERVMEEEPNLSPKVDATKKAMTHDHRADHRDYLGAVFRVRRRVLDPRVLLARIRTLRSSTVR
jgi:Cu/Ag efflux pump CusA